MPTFGDDEYNKALAKAGRGEALNNEEREGLRVATTIGSPNSERNANARTALKKDDER